MGWRLAIVIIAMTVASSYAGAADHGRFSPQARLGVAEIDENGEGCLTVMNAALREGDAAILVSLQEPQTFTRTLISKKVPQSCSRNTTFPAGASFYSFRIENSNAKPMEPAIAVAGFNGSFKVDGGKVRGDLDGDGRLESFRSCASNEGLHLTVWSGEPLTGKRIWHEYFYLGYDLEPDCDERDYGQ